MLRTPCLALIVLLLVVSTAGAVEVEFNVRMDRMIERGDFDPSQDFVDLAGSFNGWGSDPLLQMTDRDRDGTYTIRLDAFSVGQVFEYKFRINGLWDGTEEFPGPGNNRIYTVQPSGNVIDVWYNDREPDLGTGELAWWNDAVFYEIFVRSFHDSDGDGIGDFNGLTQKLDYLNDGDPNTTDDLGVTGIWLMPINDSPSYHGYDVTDYRSINPDYGTMADFQNFLAAAHARGIKVIIDFVLNHASNQHPWFQAAAAGNTFYRDWFRWADEPLDASGPWGQQVWHPSGGEYYYGVFWGGMPDLNYDNPAVESTLFNDADFWLRTIGIDGFRLDAVLYIDEDPGQLSSTQGTLDFWQRWNTRVKQANPDAMSVGEAWTNSATVNRYVTNDRLDLAFEFDLAGAILSAVNNGDPGYLRFKADEVFDLYPYGQFATFLTNHDQNRLMDVVGEDDDRVKLAASLLLTLPGVPFLYYGEEVGQLGTKPDPDIRRPMQWTDGPAAGFTTGTPWNQPGPNFTQYNVADMTGDPNSILSVYRRWIAARNGSAALRRGDLDVLPAEVNEAFAFLRSYEGEAVLVVSNTSAFPLVGLDVYDLPAEFRTGTLQVEGLYDPNDSQAVFVDGAGTLSGLSMDGYQTVALRLPGTSTSVEPQPQDERSSIELRPSAPNPFDEGTTVAFALTEARDVRLRVFDVSGREVATLLDARREAGRHELFWDGRDAQRRRLAAGVYFLRLDAGGEVDTRKVVVAR